MDAADRLSRARIETLRKGAATGAYSLSDELTRALEAERNIAEQLGEARGRLREVGTRGETVERLAGQVVDAAKRGRRLPDLAEKVAAAELTERQARAAIELLEGAQTAAGYAVLEAVDGEALIRDSLQPAHAQLKAELKTLAPKLAGRDLADAGSFVGAPEPARRAYVALEQAVGRYGVLRAARDAASALAGGPQADRGGWFSELRAPDAVGVQLGVPPSHPQPWPSDAKARLLWLSEHDAAAGWWLPTPAEQDVALREWDARTRAQRPRAVSLVAGGF